MRLFNPHRFGYGRPWPKRPLDAESQRRLDGWVAHLDVDLELAQRMLRLPARELPPLPGDDPGALFAAPVPVVDPPEAAAPPPPAPERAAGVPLMGAYARRAAARNQKN